MARRPQVQEADSPVRRHKHQFTALWWHFGKFGRQDVHVHDCFEDGCQHHLIGEGRNCSGNAADHHREIYDTEAEEWRRR